MKVTVKKKQSVTFMVKNKLPALTIFLGSFLVFGVQPMLGRTLLPAFGGTAAVWVVCLASFQLLLLVGYFYAHCASEKMGSGFRVQGSGNETRETKRKTMHIVLLALAVVWVVGFAMVRPWLLAHIGGGAYPALEVLLCVVAFVGLPYVLLSANSTLVQAWVSRSQGSGFRVQEPQNPQKTQKGEEGSDQLSVIRDQSDESDKSDVYHLYAVSNAGSLLGLLCYPFLVEPFLSLNAQWYGFAACLAVYAGLLAILARRLEPQNPQKAQNEEEGSDQSSVISDQVNAQHPTSNKAESVSPARRSRIRVGGCLSRFSDAKEITNNARCSDSGNHSTNVESEAVITQSRNKAMLLWLALPATSCFLLNAVTTHLTLDVMPLPLLWVVVLALFLLSYMIGFSSYSEKIQSLLAILTGVAFVGVCFVRGVKPSTLSFVWLVSTYCLFLLAACTFLHSWLYRSRPAPQKLTRFYLFGAVGGAMGGGLAALVAPMIFKTVAEYPLALAALTVLLCAEAYLQIKRRGLGVAVGVVTLICVVVGGAFFFRGLAREKRAVIYRGRGFFGTVQLLETKAKAKGQSGYVREYVHGTTIHGVQALLPGKDRMATAYFTPNAVGYAVVGHPKFQAGEPMRVNLVGLGIGVMLSYARTNDYYQAYEISKEVLNVATNPAYFTFVSGSPAKTDVVLGDARKGLENELAQGSEKYDVIVLDAFTGDNIPYHLSTVEAFELYFKLLKPDGILVVNISNWHLNLEPFMKSIGEHFNLPLVVFETPQNLGALAFATKCAFFCHKPENMEALPAKVRIVDLSRVKPMRQLPTDEKGSFIELIR
jgi:SAM-dependent methyltransferase